MNALILNLFILCAFGALPSYAAAAERDQVEQLRWVEKADPIADASAAVARNDFVLLGIRGYTWTIPGVDEAKKFEYREKYGMRLIEGTDDVVLGPEHLRLIGLSRGYAERYNQYVLSHSQPK